MDTGPTDLIAHDSGFVDSTTASNSTTFVFHGSSCNCTWCFYNFPSVIYDPAFVEVADSKAELRQKHREECQQAFWDKPKRSGRGRPPEARWSEETRPVRARAKRVRRPKSRRKRGH